MEKYNLIWILLAACFWMGFWLNEELSIKSKANPLVIGFVWIVSAFITCIAIGVILRIMFLGLKSIL